MKEQEILVVCKSQREEKRMVTSEVFTLAHHLHKKTAQGLKLGE